MDDFEKEFQSFMDGGSTQNPESATPESQSPVTPEPVDNEAAARAAEEKAVELAGEANNTKQKPISKELDNRFSITEATNKTVYEYANDPGKVAFTEDDRRLVAVDTNPNLIKSMMEVAESKGWETVTVSGNKEFKQNAWLEARSRGMEVVGYSPTQQDERKLTRLLEQQNAIEEDKEGQKQTDDPASQPIVDNPTPDNNSAPESPESDKGDQGKAMPPISIEGREQRKEELRTAFQTLNKEEAIEKYPELEGVYKVEPAAVAFYQAKGGLKEQEEEFTTKATERALEEVAAGREIPDFNTAAYKAPQPDNKPQSDKDIDFD